MNYLLLIFPATIWGTLGVFVNNINLPTSQLCLFRTILASLTLFIIFKLSGKKLNKEAIKANKFKLLLGGICMASNWVFFFTAYKLCSVSIATVIYYLAPAFVIALSPIVFKEKLTFPKLIGLSFAILGMCFISFTSSDVSISVLGLLSGTISAFLYACVVMFNKSIKGISGFEITMIDLTISIVVLLIYCVFITGDSFYIPDTKSIINILIVGSFHTGICYAMYFTAVQRLKAQTSAILSYCDPVSTLFFSAMFLNESMTVLQMLGAVLIIGGAIFAEVYKGKNLESRE